ncbi:hypothetical protein FACS1894171_2700 [Clostridia bacterium]|nr:hypothetical protein FACS1894171_2700 [Clostridia bacterium]
MNKTGLEELALRTVDAMQEYGLTPYSAWEEYRSCFIPIISLHKAQGRDDFDRDIITEYVRSIEQRYERGEITDRNYRGKKLGAQRLTEMHDTGKLEWSAPKRVSKYKLRTCIHK